MAERQLTTVMQARVDGYVNGMKRASESSTKLALSNANMAREFGRSSAAMRASEARFATASSGVGKLNMAMTQLTFAADDAAAVWGTSGFSGALRAAGNNLTMTAMMLGGLQAQILATVALVGIQMYQAFSKTNKEIKKQADNAQLLKENLDKLRESEERQKSLVDIGRKSYGKGAESVRVDLRDATSEMDTLKREQDDLESRRESLIAMIRVMESDTEFDPLKGGGDPVLNRLGFDLESGANRVRQLFGAENPYTQIADAQKQLAAVEEEINKNSIERVRKGQELLELQKAMNREKELEADAAKEAAVHEQLAANRKRRIEEHEKRVERAKAIQQNIDTLEQWRSEAANRVRSLGAEMAANRASDPALKGISGLSKGSFEDLNSDRMRKVAALADKTREKDPNLEIAIRQLDNIVHRRAEAVRQHRELMRAIEKMAPAGVGDFN